MKFHIRFRVSDSGGADHLLPHIATLGQRLFDTPKKIFIFTIDRKS
jgi:inactivated superfamily I helicase